jgi:tetratricopeptide (TPR) repeat protein
MCRKNLLFSLATTIAVLLAFNIAAFAQTVPLRGHVVLKQADGTSAPVAGAIIDVFRTDVSGKYETKTNKKGEFVFAGLPLGGTFTIAASAPNAAPNFLQNIRAGSSDTDYELVLTPGDGKRLTIADIRAAAAGAGPAGAAASGGGGGKESAADRAKREELIKKNAEIEEKNKKITASNEIVSRTFKAGNDALMAKNYDEAIKQYDEGLAADPEQSALLTNRSLALTNRGVTKYNAAIQGTNDAAKSSGLEAAKLDWKAAAESATKAVDLLKAQTAPADAAAQANYTKNKYAALNARAEAMKFYVSKVDPSQADAGLAAYQEYIAAETDPVKKAKAQRDAAQMLFDAGAVDKAIAEYQKILAANPDDVDASLGMGLALFSTGDKAKFQDAANYLQHFVDKAPDTNRYKADAKAVLEELKNQQVKPQRTTAGGRRRG